MESRNNSVRKALESVTVRDYAKSLEPKGVRVRYSIGHRALPDGETTRRWVAPCEKAQLMYRAGWNPEYRRKVGDFGSWKTYKTVGSRRGSYLVEPVDGDTPLIEAAGIKRLPSSVRTPEQLTDYVANKKGSSIFFEYLEPCGHVATAFCVQSAGGTDEEAYREEQIGKYRSLYGDSARHLEHLEEQRKTCEENMARYKEKLAELGAEP